MRALGVILKSKTISGKTFYTKVIFPGIWFGFLGVVSIITLVINENPAMIIPILFMMLFGYILFRKIAWDLVDEVIDEGSSLYFRKGTKEQRVNLEDIINISHAAMNSPDRVTIHSRTSGEIGEELAFSLPMRLNPFAKNPLVKELIERVDRARNT